MKKRKEETNNSLGHIDFPTSHAKMAANTDEVAREPLVRTWHSIPLEKKVANESGRGEKELVQKPKKEKKW